MIRLRVLSLLDEDARVRALHLTTVKVRPEQVLEHGWCSISATLESGSFFHPGRGRPFHLRETQIAPANHAIRTANGVRRFKGYLLARSAVDLVDYLEQRYVPLPDTALGGAFGLRGESRAAWLDMVERALQATWSDPEHQDVHLQSGMFVGSEVELSHVMQAQVGGRLCYVGRARPPRIAVRRRVRFGDHDVPVEAWAAIHRPGGSLVWWDGHRLGVAEGLAALPATLSRHLARGVALRRFRIDIPQVDLRPLALVRIPRSEEVVDAAPTPPPVASRAGVLVPSTASVPLLDAEGAPLPVPVITEPAQALAVLRRTAGRAYVPWAEPQRDVREARSSFREHRWWVIGSPRGIR